MHIEFFSDTMILGDPSYIDLIVTNHSKQKVFITDHFYYLKGMNHKPALIMVSDKGDTLKPPPDYVSIGNGRRSYNFTGIEPDSSTKYKAFLPSGVIINQEGSYTVFVDNLFFISLTANPTPEKYSHKEYLKSVTFLKAKSELIVVEDSIKLGKIIQRIVDDFGLESQDRIFSGGSGFQFKQEALGWSLSEASQNLKDDMLRIRSLRDNRIVPFLSEAYLENKDLTKVEAISLLSEFANDTLAFNTMKIAASYEENTPCELMPYSIHLSWSHNFIKQTAIGGIMKSKIPEALEFLISMSENSSACDRYFIVTWAGYYMGKSDAMLIYKAFSNDENLVIRNTAQQLIEKNNK